MIGLIKGDTRSVRLQLTWICNFAIEIDRADVTMQAVPKLCAIKCLRSL